MDYGYQDTKKNYLTKKEQEVLSQLENKEIICTKDFQKELKPKNIVLSQLVRKGYYIRLKKGILLSRDAFFERPYELISKSNKGVIAYISALHIHGLIDYEPNIIYVMVDTRPYEKQIRSYKIKAITTKHKFGIEELSKAFVTDIEKTILDCLLHPQKAGGYTNIITALSESKLQWKKMLEYLELFNKGSLYQKLGYLLTRINKDTPQYVIKELKKRVKNNCRLISNTNIPYVYDKEWKIMDNIGKREWI